MGLGAKEYSGACLFIGNKSFKQVFWIVCHGVMSELHNEEFAEEE